MNATRPDVGLERLLTEFEREVLDASDEEIIEVAHELGMKPEIRGSSAFFGVTILSDYGARAPSKEEIRCGSGFTPGVSKSD